MDLMALSIFFAAFVICSLLVFFISFYGTKEVTFEENLKASHGVKKSSKADAKKKAKKGSKGPETSEIVSFFLSKKLSRHFLWFFSSNHKTLEAIVAVVLWFHDLFFCWWLDYFA